MEAVTKTLIDNPYFNAVGKMGPFKSNKDIVLGTGQGLMGEQITKKQVLYAKNNALIGGAAFIAMAAAMQMLPARASIGKLALAVGMFGVGVGNIAPGAGLLIASKS